jgi:hypothetical protein
MTLRAAVAAGRKASGGICMGWVVFEVLLAFALAVFIVWWTFPKETRNEEPDDDQ